MSDYSTIKGQAWIYKDTSLVQDEIRIYDNSITSNVIVTLIDNIWNDLLSSAGQWKKSGEKFFYWEYEQTAISDGVNFFTEVKIECPHPKPGLIKSLFPSDIDPKDWDLSTLESDWAKYWAEVEKRSPSINQEVIKNRNITEENINLLLL